MISKQHPRASALGNALLLLTTASCAFPRPADVVGDASAGDSGPAGPIIAIHVSSSGDDANDGLALPVKTLKHAIGLAAANTQVSQIVLETGTYSMSGGETFPYTVPPNVTIVGPAGGGAVLAGNKTGPGITVDTGGLQDIDMQDFMTAVTVTGPTSLKNIRVLTSMLAIQAETAADLTVNNLDIAGMVGGCGEGIVLNGGARLTATTVSARNLQTAIRSKDRSMASIRRATISGDGGCAQTASLIAIASSMSFTLADGVLDGGVQGVQLDPRSASFRAVVSGTIIRNMKADAMSGGFVVGDSAGSIQIADCELSNNGGAGVELGLGTWTLLNTKIQNNKTVGVFSQNGTLVMRGCSVTGSQLGVSASVGAAVDLGTASDPGGNIFQVNMLVGVDVGSNLQVSAIGNIWNPDVQGADAKGQYATSMIISGPVTAENGNNFSIAAGDSLLR